MHQHRTVSEEQIFKGQPQLARRRRAYQPKTRRTIDTIDTVQRLEGKRGRRLRVKWYPTRMTDGPRRSTKG